MTQPYEDWSLFELMYGNVKEVAKNQPRRITIVDKRGKNKQEVDVEIQDKVLIGSKREDQDQSLTNLLGGLI